MYYKIEVTIVETGATSVCEESSDEDEEDDDENFDPSRPDGGGDSYYVGGVLYNKWMGWIKHGRGCMRKYPDDRRRVEEENAHGIYIYNEHYCEGDCGDSCKFCHCERDVGEADEADEADEAEVTTDSDSDSDYHRCALHESKDEICTNLDEETIELHHYCIPCAENVKDIEADCFLPYLERLFKELTGKSFTGDWENLRAFFDMINPFEFAYVKSIETYEDYVSLLMPTDQVIRKRDEILQQKITAYLKEHEKGWLFK